MNVKVLYFASLREAIGQPGEELELPAGVATVGALRAHLAARGNGWQALAGGRNVRAAVNQRMVGADEPVAAGDEVAFFPPVTGG
ncbi:molybdopterin converting factor subunit 1 [Thauera linaloolentis]|uniref:Molybdopterin synthase sulfur carrier subunit n=1 Tax=Thauera linaloolentis (strain DSM 12138 / JCM 21573 / CCUG 41526 / CIP 105981 / IAM 15112 / NBRC 102519 / 47Lol) TaxID=1123367 RepID=N6YYV1_THAL4|nr:molybdopterin converting factor subunit 1 [Thauera linaloolentis]ENO85119.1 molybdopterin converting factor subunit 1 [Thauera linaloolentis 47Lol = DSM 12138]MCM8565878.1 molybdopterin converting factor subunit 1 [Thauera linaloolentis]